MGRALEITVDGGADRLGLDAVLQHYLDAHAVRDRWGDYPHQHRAGSYAKAGEVEIAEPAPPSFEIIGLLDARPDHRRRRSKAELALELDDGGQL